MLRKSKCQYFTHSYSLKRSFFTRSSDWCLSNISHVISWVVILFTDDWINNKTCLFSKSILKDVTSWPQSLTPVQSGDLERWKRVINYSHKLIIRHCDMFMFLDVCNQEFATSCPWDFSNKSMCHRLKIFLFQCWEMCRSTNGALVNGVMFTMLMRRVHMNDPTCGIHD